MKRTPQFYHLVSISLTATDVELFSTPLTLDVKLRSAITFCTTLCRVCWQYLRKWENQFDIGKKNRKFRLNSELKWYVLLKPLLAQTIEVDCFPLTVFIWIIALHILECRSGLMLGSDSVLLREPVVLFCAGAVIWLEPKSSSVDLLRKVKVIYGNNIQ